MRSIFMPGAALVAAFALTTVPTSAQVVVQSFDTERDGHPGPIATLGFVASPYFGHMRGAVAQHYGNAVVFGTPEHPDGVPTVTAEVLDNADVFVVTGATVTLSAEEACLLESFVEHGGAVLSIRAEWTLPTLLGATIGVFGGHGHASVVDPTSPIVAGPFGTVPSPVLTGANSEFAPGGAGVPVLADGGRAMLVAFGDETGHRGRAVLVGDEEIFLSGPVPFPASLRGVYAANQLLFANIVDYLIQAPGLDADGRQALEACVDADGDGSGADVDCDDTAPGVHPDAGETLDGVDNDCDGQVDEGLDGDGDGVPDLLDRCDEPAGDGGVDAEGCPVVCDVRPPADPDADGDGVPASQDCDDANPAVWPGAVDLPGDAIDDDCSGTAACDPGADWRNHGRYVTCVVRHVRKLVAAGVLSAEEAVKLIRQAAQSDVGHTRPWEDAKEHGRR